MLALGSEQFQLLRRQGLIPVDQAKVEALLRRGAGFLTISLYSVLHGAIEFGDLMFFCLRSWIETRYQ